MKQTSSSTLSGRLILVCCLSILPMSVVSLWLVAGPAAGAAALVRLLALIGLSIVIAMSAGYLLIIRPFQNACAEARGESEGRQRLQKQLINSNTFLHGIIDGINDPVYVKDTAGRYLVVNRAMADLVGRAPEQIIGADDEQLYGREAAAPKLEDARRIIASGFAQTYEETAAAPDYPHQYLTTAAPFRDADGRIAGLVAIRRDITSQKQTERTARESERHLRRVMDSLLVFISIMTTDGVVTGANNLLRQQVKARGYRFEDLLGQYLPDVSWWRASPAARTTLIDAIQRAVRGETVRMDGVTIITRHASIVLDGMLAPMSDEEGRITHLILSTVDVTERKRAEDRAREQQAELYHLERARTMGQMAAGLAHELRQPLGAIVNYATASAAMLGDGRMQPAALAETLGHIATEASRAGDIIRRMRSMVKKRSPEVRPVEVNDLVNEAVSLLKFDLRHAGIVPRLELSPALPPAWADGIQIQQVLVNLVHNAIDAMASADPTCRSLTLATRHGDDGLIHVDVVDNGCGVAPEDLNLIFSSFYTTKPHGLGIGLALCKTIIEDHGGHLYARSNDSGGMTFAFSLKVAAAARE